VRGKHWTAIGSAVTVAAVATLLAGAGTGDASVSSARGLRAAAANFAGRVAARSDTVIFPHLTAVSCRSASLCMAVGAFGPTHATTHPYSEMWDGTAWRLLPTPGPPHAHQLTGVSCASRISCVAVGLVSYSSPFADAWNGRTWRVLTMPSQQAVMNGISCPTAGSCMAVGRVPGGNAVADEWDGKTWKVLTMPTIAGALNGNLAAVSCISSKSCIAVGSYTSSSSGNPVVALVEQWNGTTWQVLTTPAVNPAGSVLSGVSCVSLVSCVAVGFAGPLFGGTDGALAEAWDGHHWTVLPAAVPPGSAFSILSGVSCVAGISCMAIGMSAPAVGDAADLAETWDGSKWKLTPTPASFVAGPVSCTAAASCMVTGGTLAEQWNGSSWRALRTLRFDSLAGISCTRRTRCMAVGGYVTGSAQGLTLAERWNGRAWRVRTAPTPAGSGTMSGVSCVSAIFCVAVATVSLDPGGRSFAEKWNGSTWRLLGELPDGVKSVSCATTSSCVAVGGGAAAAWNGRSWRPLAPVVTGGYSTNLAGVSCAAATRCVAVGSVSSIGRPIHARAEIWNGREWRILKLPKQGGNIDGALTAVDCTARTRCMAVGSSQRGQNLAEQWTGRTWRLLAAPGPVGLTDVSCVGAGSCLAVGSYTLAYGGKPLQVAERWNGRHWGPVRTPVRGGVLSAVSCVRGPRCVAVGQAGGLATRTLAEQWNGVTLRPMRTRNP
jgi:hypothetical protein